MGRTVVLQVCCLLGEHSRKKPEVGSFLHSWPLGPGTTEASQAPSSALAKIGPSVLGIGTLRHDHLQGGFSEMAGGAVSPLHLHSGRWETVLLRLTSQGGKWAGSPPVPGLPRASLW